jgi:hypothetical protein
VEVQCDLTCQFEISADFSHYDSIDKDEMSMGTGSTTVTDDVMVSVFLTIQATARAQRSRTLRSLKDETTAQYDSVRALPRNTQ